MSRDTKNAVTQIAKNYYDEVKTNSLYTTIWGGEHIHYGIYGHLDESIHDASARTVQVIAQTLQTLNKNSLLIDLGAGYGGAARYLAKEYGCHVCCLNLSELQNQQNQELNQQQHLSHLIEVRQGNFEEIPYSSSSFDIVWSQDAFLHSGARHHVLEEARRILKPGGEIIFTDPMQSESCPPGYLQSAFDRLGISDMGSCQSYIQMAMDLGFTKPNFIDLSKNVPIHYRRFSKAIRDRYQEMVDLTSEEFIEKTLSSIEPWIEYYEQGYMQWGILHCFLP